MKTALAGIPVLSDGMIAELYTITVSTGVTYYFTTADFDIPYRGVIYVSNDFNLERSAITTSVGVSVDDVTLTVHRSDRSSGISQMAMNGFFDNAKVKIERARDTYVVHLFEGMVSDTRVDRVKVDLVVSSPLLLLNTEMPRNAYSSGCIKTLFDSGCGLVKSAYAHNYVMLSGSTVRRLAFTSAYPDGYFDLGMVTITSGVNSGVICTIKSQAGGFIWLSYPLANAPSIGDTFTAYPGCNKTLARCTEFSNQAKFRGFPFIPTPEASL